MLLANKSRHLFRESTLGLAQLLDQFCWLRGLLQSSSYLSDGMQFLLHSLDLLIQIICPLLLNVPAHFRVQAVATFEHV